MQKKLFKQLSYITLYVIFSVFVRGLSLIKLRDLPAGAIIITPPGGGNIGDDALVQSAIENVKSSPVIVLNSGHKFDIKKEDITQFDVQALFYGSIISFSFSLIRQCSLFLSCKEIYVIGADIMDGRYNETASIRRSFVAALFGPIRNVRILGFSLNKAPTNSALFWLNRAGKNGVKIFLRDPKSFERANNFRIENSYLSADIVFAHEPLGSPLPCDFSVKGNNNDYVIINASGLIMSANCSGIKSMVNIIEDLVSREKIVHLLPHVMRPGADDLEILTAIYNEVDSDLIEQKKIILHKSLKKPEVIREMCRNCNFVITGRMHLGVLAMRYGVPAFIFESQDKVSGLLDFFEASELLLDVNTEFDRVVINNSSDQKIVTYRKKISKNLENVIMLAQENFR